MRKGCQDQKECANSAEHCATDFPEIPDEYVGKQGWATDIAAETENLYQSFILLPDLTKYLQSFWIR